MSHRNTLDVVLYEMVKRKEINLIFLFISNLTVQSCLPHRLLISIFPAILIYLKSVLFI